MMAGLILLGVFVLFAGAVVFILWDQDRNHAASRQVENPNGASVLMTMAEWKAMGSDLRRSRIHLSRLRRVTETLIEHWPMAFDPEDLKAAQALIDEIAEAEP